ncbi:hypothetical protein GGS23DRAFT_503916 [Durotheca rogersii]|uniref:uncharacterized protein n=1 Tax=Durotheca rogersii TaxID=419775 RepID=UPI00221F32A4|nr:uncharacterized protein GGS23DRAFT_503916 [Durotheca rogersii]KAI5853657.1 hypothetical protein GGS23DRAFT_503916 [Durotheca rogersii]
MMMRFPDKPIEDESPMTKTFIPLFAPLYPWAERAAHFHILVAKYPPQSRSRNAAHGWACFVHNLG